MATTSLWRIRGPIGHVLNYAKNAEKISTDILPLQRLRICLSNLHFSDCSEKTDLPDLYHQAVPAYRLA